MKSVFDESGWKLVIIWTFFLILANGASSQSNDFPYEVKLKYLSLLAVGKGFDLWGNHLVENHNRIPFSAVQSMHPSEINQFDRPAVRHWSLKWDARSDISRDVLLFAPMALFSPEIFNENWNNAITLAVMYANTLFFTKGITALTKGTAARVRPYMFNTSIPAEKRYSIAEVVSDEQASFFSGHTSVSFAAGVFFAKTFEDVYGRSLLSKIIWGGCLTTAAFTGYSRYRSGRHYPSDILVGAVTGSVIGYTVPLLHHRSIEEKLAFHLLPESVNLVLTF